MGRVEEIARGLGISRSRAYQLRAEGRLSERGAVRYPARPLSAVNAWRLAHMLVAARIHRSHPTNEKRLVTTIKSLYERPEPYRHLAGLARSRADTIDLALPRRQVGRLRRDSRVRPSRVDSSLVDFDTPIECEVYLTAHTLFKVGKSLSFEATDTPNVRLHIAPDAMMRLQTFPRGLEHMDLADHLLEGVREAEGPFQTLLAERFPSINHWRESGAWDSERSALPIAPVR